MCVASANCMYLFVKKKKKVLCHLIFNSNDLHNVFYFLKFDDGTCCVSSLPVVLLLSDMSHDARATCSPLSPHLRASCRYHLGSGWFVLFISSALKF